MGFTLLALSAEEQGIEAFQQAAQFVGVPLKVVRDTCEGERKAYEARLVLVRPDQYVVWAGDELPRDAVRLMQKISGIV